MSDDQWEEFVLVLEFEKIGRGGKIKTLLNFWFFCFKWNIPILHRGQKDKIT
jgi:hypothetical protein